MHKTCFHFYTAMFYYLLGNIRPRYRSQLKAIQLIAVVNASIIESNGVDAVLTPLVDDIKKLEKVGVELNGTSFLRRILLPSAILPIL